MVYLSKNKYSNLCIINVTNSKLVECQTLINEIVEKNFSPETASNVKEQWLRIRAKIDDFDFGHKILDEEVKAGAITATKIAYSPLRKVELPKIEQF